MNALMQDRLSQRSQQTPLSGGKRPPFVIQAERNMCWAACMESWSRHVNYYLDSDQWTFVEKYSNSKPKGGLYLRGDKYKRFLLDWTLRPYLIMEGMMNTKWLAQEIKNWHCCMFIFRSGNGVSHAVLAYEYVERTGQVRAMDPIHGYVVKAANQLPEILVFTIDRDLV